MKEEIKIDRKEKKFNELWKESKKEIFRLQLLNTYRVDDEKKLFEDYKKGKDINLSKDGEFNNWLHMIQTKKNQGVRIIDLEIVELPLNRYNLFGIDLFLSKTNKIGQETLYIERKNACKLISGFKDYWMFDSKAIIPMNYNKYGYFLNMDRVIRDKKELAKYIELKNNLLKIAIPMKKFLRNNKIK